MSTNSTENDAEIARILAEDEDYYLKLVSTCSDSSSASSTLNCHASSEHITFNNTNRTEANTSINPNKDEKNTQNYEVDSEIAYILQIEEIVLLENKISKKTVDYNSSQLEKAHADMTQALTPTNYNDSSIITRIFAMFTTIQSRYAECTAKNQSVIEQIQQLSIQLAPLLIPFQTKGKVNISKAVIPGLAISLITNVLQGRLPLNDAKSIILNMLHTWNESTVWYQFLEQLVYILVAVTIPAFTKGAISKAMEKVISLK